MDFSKDFQVLEKIGQDWKDHMSDTGGVRQTSSERTSAASTSSTR